MARGGSSPAGLFLMVLAWAAAFGWAFRHMLARPQGPVGELVEGTGAGPRGDVADPAKDPWAREERRQAIPEPIPEPRRVSARAQARQKLLEEVYDCVGMGAMDLVVEKLRAWQALDDGSEPEKTLYAYRQLAHASLMVGDREGALRTAEAGLRAAPADPELLALRDLIVRERRELAGNLQVRTWRRTGSARELTGTVGVLHILVYGSDSEPWTFRTASRLGTDVSLADGWMAERARKGFGVTRPPRFEHRWVRLPPEPFWSATAVPGGGTPPEIWDAWKAAVLQRLGTASLKDAFERRFSGRRFDNRVVVFHADLYGTSFAMSEAKGYQSRGDLELALVRVGLRNGFELRHAPTYTHEFFHTFGADDLYDKAEDPEVPRSDVMIGCPRLSACEVSPLTAYAVGWTNRTPRLGNLRLLRLE